LERLARYWHNCIEKDAITDKERLVNIIEVEVIPERTHIETTVTKSSLKSLEKKKEEPPQKRKEEIPVFYSQVFGEVDINLL